MEKVKIDGVFGHYLFKVSKIVIQTQQVYRQIRLHVSTEFIFSVPLLCI